MKPRVEGPEVCLSCPLRDAYPHVEAHYRWEHDVWSFFGQPTGPTMSVRRDGDQRTYAEHYVTANVIEALLQSGYDARHMAIERRIADGSRPDLTIEPPTGPVEMWESKAWRPGKDNREQAARYLEAGRSRWPDRDVRVYLVWPADPHEFPHGSETLRVEPVA